MSEERDIERAQRIADLLANEYVQEALAEAKDDFVQQWKSGSTVEERELAHANYRGLEALIGKLGVFVDRGIVASTNMAKRKSR